MLFCIFSSVQNIWIPFWVDKTRPQVTPELIPSFSLNPGKLNGESSRLSEVFGAFPGSIFFQKSLRQRNHLIVLYYSFLSQVKLGVLKFLASDLFEPTDVLCHFIVATGDTRHRYVIIRRGYYRAARRYEISLRVLKNISQVSTANEWNIFNTRREVLYLQVVM